MRLILVFLIICLIGLQYRLWIGQGSWAEIVSLENKIEEQNVINQRLQGRNEILESEVTDLKNGMDAVEERARRELGLIKQDETFYLIVDKDKKVDAEKNDQ